MPAPAAAQPAYVQFAEQQAATARAEATRARAEALCLSRSAARLERWSRRLAGARSLEARHRIRGRIDAALDERAGCGGHLAALGALAGSTVAPARPLARPVVSLHARFELASVEGPVEERFLSRVVRATQRRLAFCYERSWRAGTSTPADTVFSLSYDVDADLNTSEAVAEADGAVLPCLEVAAATMAARARGTGAGRVTIRLSLRVIEQVAPPAPSTPPMEPGGFGPCIGCLDGGGRPPLI